MKYLKTITAAIAAISLLAACDGRHSSSGNTRAEVIVTILPLKYLVENITGDDFPIGVLVPSGASPETFEPTPKQYIALNEARMVFSTGLIDFENALLARMQNKERLTDLSRGIELMEGSCSHDHTHASQQHDGEEESHQHEAEAHDHDGHDHNAESGHGHMHGIDPHIWTSPQELRIMARNAFEAIMRQYPDSAKYRTAYRSLDERLSRLDARCRRMCEESQSHAFVIYHPALTYYARAYGLEQIAIENDGKEPSAKHLARIIDEARDKGVKCLLYQSQYPRSVVDVVARDMGVECREIDPLAEDAERNIIAITKLITGN